MKLDIPFYPQETPTDCGPTALKMILEYFGQKEDLEKLRELALAKEGKATWTMALAKASGELGFKTEFYTTSLTFIEKGSNKDFYNAYSDSPKENNKKLLQFKEACEKVGVKIYEKSISLKEILSKTTIDCVPLVVLNWNSIINREGYYGHFVPVVGYDNEFVEVHNPDGPDAKAFLKLKKDLFDKSRKSKTDEEIVFIHRKK